MWLTLWHSWICKIVMLIQNIWKPSSIYYCQNYLIWRNFHENFCWPELSFSFRVLAKLFAWLTLRKKGQVKGDQSEPPIQNLAKMTLNKFDYSNHVQWNLQEACPQNENTKCCFDYHSRYMWLTLQSFCPLNNGNSLAY